MVNMVIDKSKGSKFLVSDESIDVVNLSKDRETSIARINIKDEVTTVCLYQNGKSKGIISLNIGVDKVKIDSNNNTITYLDKDIKDLARLYDINLQEGEITDIDKIRYLCKILAHIMITAIHLSDYSWGVSKMVINGKKSFEGDFLPKIIIFTGIASKYIFTDKKEDVFVDGNLGMLLYQEINNYDI